MAAEDQMPPHEFEILNQVMQVGIAKSHQKYCRTLPPFSTNEQTNCTAFVNRLIAAILRATSIERREISTPLT